MLNLGSNTLMPETTLQSPGRVNAVWLSYCPGLSLLQKSTFNHFSSQLLASQVSYDGILVIVANLPAISWYVLAMTKSVAFIEIVSARNWHAK